MSYIGAIDQGTTSTRFILFDRSGEIAASAQCPLPNSFPHAGWQEIDPEALYTSVIDTMRMVEQQGFDCSQVASIGLTNQRETTIVFNRRTGTPYYNAIVWCDTRTEDIAASIINNNPQGQDIFRDKTGLPISTYFSALKIKWLLENCLPFKQDIETHPEDVCIGTVDTWLLWKLTKQFKTDISNASRTLLFNINTLQWDHELCAYFGIHRPDLCLPRVFHNTHEFGTIQNDLPYAGVCINAIMGDQQASLLGMGCLDKYSVKCTYGTGCFLLMNTSAQPVKSRNGLLTTVGFQLSPLQYDENDNIIFNLQDNIAKAQAAQDNGTFDGSNIVHYALEGSVASCGSLFQWLIDSMKVAENSQQICDFAIELEDNGDIIIVPAFTGLLAPHWCLDARGIIIGLTRYTTNKHLCRAVLESICCQVRDVVVAMSNDLLSSNGDSSSTETTTTTSNVLHQKLIKSLKVDGGVTKSHYLLTFQSGILDIPVAKAIMQERTALGAAIAAGLGSGYFKSVQDVDDAIWQNGDKQSQVPSPTLTPPQSAVEQPNNIDNMTLQIAQTDGVAVDMSQLISPIPSYVSPPRQTKFHPHVVTKTFKIYNCELHKQSRDNALLQKKLQQEATQESNSNKIDTLGQLDDAKYFDFNFEKFLKKWAVAVEKSKGWASIE